MIFCKWLCIYSCSYTWDGKGMAELEQWPRRRKSSSSNGQSSPLEGWIAWRWMGFCKRSIQRLAANWRCLLRSYLEKLFLYYLNQQIREQEYFALVQGPTWNPWWRYEYHQQRMRSWLRLEPQKRSWYPWLPRALALCIQYRLRLSWFPAHLLMQHQTVRELQAPKGI